MKSNMISNSQPRSQFSRKCWQPSDRYRWQSSIDLYWWISKLEDPMENYLILEEENGQSVSVLKNTKIDSEQQTSAAEEE